jgi:trans-aconitate methyltransferase
MLKELTNYLAFYLADRPHPQVLDLGTGTGSLAGLVLNRIATATVVAIDTDPAMIAEARDPYLSRKRNCPPSNETRQSTKPEESQPLTGPVGVAADNIARNRCRKTR